VPLADLAALYVQFRSHLDSDEEKLATFTQSVDATIESAHPRHLLVDLRFDTGATPISRATGSARYRRAFQDGSIC